MLKLYAVNPANEVKTFFFDTDRINFISEDGIGFFKKDYDLEIPEYKQPNLGTFSKDSNELLCLKILLGTGCNSRCKYCLQDEYRTKLTEEAYSNFNLEEFIEFITSRVSFKEGARIELWGGEPFLRWDILKPLGLALRAAYPKVMISVITNGLSLDKEKTEWVKEIKGCLVVSHDGPTHNDIRGKNPFDSPVNTKAIQELCETSIFSKSLPKNTVITQPNVIFTLNPMFHKENMSRKAVLDYFKEVLGHDNFKLGEGGIIQCFSPTSKEYSLDAETLNKYSVILFEELCLYPEILDFYEVIKSKLNFFRSCLEDENYTLQKLCDNNRPDTSDVLCINLKGEVTEFRNTYTTYVLTKSENWIPLDKVQTQEVKLINTHWTTRKYCRKCPVLTFCRNSSCYHIDDENSNRTCDNNFAESIAYFAYVFEIFSGCRLFRMEGVPKEREEIWNLKPIGTMNENL